MKVRLATAKDKDFKWIATAMEDIKTGDYVVLEEDEQVQKECCKKHTPGCVLMSLMSQLCCNKCQYFRRPPSSELPMDEAKYHKEMAKRWGNLKIWDLLSWWRLERDQREHDNICSVGKD